MRRLSSLAWRTVRARLMRSTLTIAGIGLGVAVLFAALATNASIDASVRQTVAEMLGRTQIRVAAFEEQGLTEPTIAAVSRTAGVAVAAPELERPTYPQASGAGVTGSALPAPLTVLGIDPPRDAQLHDLSLASGSALVAGVDGNVLVSETLARAEHLSLGGRLTLEGAATPGPQTYRVVGLLRGDGSLPDANGRLAVVTLSDAAHLFDTAGVTRIDVGLAAGADQSTVIAALESAITREPYVLSVPADIEASLRASAADFQATIALVAAVALFVGAFLIFNTLSMTVTERLHDVGLLRSAGTTRRQVNQLVLLQALLLGGAGSVLGVVLGTGLALLIEAYLAATHAVSLAGLSLTPGAVVLALVLGVVVTLAAAFEPAWRAGRIPPVEALRANVVSATNVGARLRWLVVVFVAVAAAGLVLWPRSATSGAGPSTGAIDLSIGSLRPLLIYGLLLLATLVTPLVTGPLGRLVGLPVSLFFRTEERLARSSLVRDRSRTALTVGALTIGLAMIVAVGTAAQASNRSATAWLADVVPGSELVTSIRPVGAGEPPLHDLAAVRGVARVSPIATFGLDIGGTRVDGAAISGADYAADGRLTFIAGDRATALRRLDTSGTAIVPQSVADRLDIGVGQLLVFATARGPTSLTVTGIVARSLPGATGESILVGWPDALARFGATGAEAYAIRFQPGREAAARPALDEVARSEALQPAGLDAIQGAVGDAVARVLDLFNALAIVAVLAAGLGIVNTLSMSVVERVREIGVLRATGMTRRQVSRMIAVEAGLLGVAGAILGCLTGLAVGVALLAAAGGRATVAVEPPWGSMGAAAAFGIVLSIVAAIYPARLAGRVSIVRAVQFE